MNTKNKAAHLLACAGIVVFGLTFAFQAKAETVTFSVRYQDLLLVDHRSIDIPAVGSVTVATQDGIERQVNARSVLGMLASIDGAEESFRLSKATYYAWVPPSVYVNCIFVQSRAVDACENWLYAVNGQDPQVGMDAHIPQAGSQVFVYFGVSKRVSAAGTLVSPNAPFTLTAQSYLFESDAWGPLAGVTIGITQPNLENPFSPIEVVTGAVDGVGSAVFSLLNVGQYDAGIREDYYTFKLPITVFNPLGGGLPVSPTGASASSTGGAGGGTVPPQQIARVDRAVAFIASRQEAAGLVLQSQRLTDWAAIALAAENASSDAAGRARSYLLTNPDPGSLLTDLERRAMALMALGVSPYSGTSTNYIEKIAGTFDGTQIGDPALFNDDVFGLLVLSRAGYTASDPVIAKTIEFILSKQQPSGAFVDVDMTAATVQALVLAQEASGVANALQKAKVYLVARRGVDGGFGGSVASASWAAQALAALGEDTIATRSYLALKQAEDGGWVLGEADESRVWETSYAIPAALGKPWGVLLQPFSKPPAEARGGTVPPQPVAVSERGTVPPMAMAGRVVFEGAQTVSGLNSPKAALMIPAGVELKQENGSEWTGTLEVTAALSLDETVEKAGESMRALNPRGFVKVWAGEGVRVQASKTMLVSIPVFSENGVSLSAYRRSEGEKDFAYLEQCVADNGVCVVSTDHLSEFLAVAAVGGSDPPTPVVAETARGGTVPLNQEKAEGGPSPIVVAEEGQALLGQEEEAAPLTAGVMKVSSQRVEFLYVVFGTFFVLGSGYALLWFLERKKREEGQALLGKNPQ